MTVAPGGLAASTTACSVVNGWVLLLPSPSYCVLVPHCVASYFRTALSSHQPGKELRFPEEVRYPTCLKQRRLFHAHSATKLCQDCMKLVLIHSMQSLDVQMDLIRLLFVCILVLSRVMAVLWSRASDQQSTDKIQGSGNCPTGQVDF